MLLALGLNVVVGWGGLLDLGYVAFYGIGAYAYAMLDSDQFGIHLPTLVVGARSSSSSARWSGCWSACPSRRLTGDYLAIVTLFFLQLFQTLTTNGDSVVGHNITGGAVRDSQRRSVRASSATRSPSQHAGVFAVSYLYVALAFFAVVFVALRLRQHLADRPRVAVAARGSARRRGDGHAGQLAQAARFSFGAAVAALTGTLFAALTGSVFPLDVLLHRC